MSATVLIPIVSPNLYDRGYEKPYHFITWQRKIRKKHEINFSVSMVLVTKLYYLYYNLHIVYNIYIYICRYRYRYRIYIYTHLSFYISSTSSLAQSLFRACPFISHHTIFLNLFFLVNHGCVWMCSGNWWFDDIYIYIYMAFIYIYIYVYLYLSIYISNIYININYVQIIL